MTSEDIKAGGVVVFVGLGAALLFFIEPITHARNGVKRLLATRKVLLPLKLDKALGPQERLEIMKDHRLHQLLAAQPPRLRRYLPFTVGRIFTILETDESILKRITKEIRYYALFFLVLFIGSTFERLQNMKEAITLDILWHNWGSEPFHFLDGLALMAMCILFVRFCIELSRIDDLVG